MHPWLAPVSVLVRWRALELGNQLRVCKAREAVDRVSQMRSVIPRLGSILTFLVIVDVHKVFQLMWRCFGNLVLPLLPLLVFDPALLATGSIKVT